MNGTKALMRCRACRTRFVLVRNSSGACPICGNDHSEYLREAEEEEVEAGRALDCLVAERVMGWRVDYDSYRHWTACGGVDVADLVLTAPGDIFHGERNISEIPHYSTDIAAAWQIVERLRQQGRVIIVKADGLRTYPGACPYTVVVDGVPSAFHGDAPLAVCLAALAALDIKLPLASS